MALQRYTKAVDGTIPVPALLYDDEELLANQDNTGIYDGLQKSPEHQAGTIHVTTHRLFYIDARHPFAHSFAMDLSYVTRTEYYAGLFKSSPKVTIHLVAGNVAVSVLAADREAESAFESWECEVCGNRNPPGLSPTAARICTLCGVPRSLVPIPAALAPAPVLPPHQGHISSSLPSSAFPSTFFSSTSPPPLPHSPPLPSIPPPPPLRQQSSVACPACTFLNHPSMHFCEMCNTPLPRITSPQVAAATPRSLTKSAPSTRPVSPDVDEDGQEDCPTMHMIKLSFRKGGDKSFYAVLRRSLKGKAWQGKAIGRADVSNADVVFNPNPGRSGIHGIMRTVETSAQNTATDMSDALKDLEALMVKAKDMVRLAAELNERLTASSTTTTTSTTSATSTASIQLSSSSSPSPSPSMYSTTTLVPSTEPEEATFIRSSLSQLGLQMSNTPVTLDMIRDERRWIEELAQELTKVLQGPKDDNGPSGFGRGVKNTGMMGKRGIIALDEVWGGWNRARGVALIPPSTFLLVLPHLPYCTSPPIRSRTFTSGLSVLHTPPYTHAAFTSRLSSLLVLTGPKTTVEVAHEEGITIGLASEMIGAVEADGEVCRDDGSASIRGGGSGVEVEIKWWANIFTNFVWDGEE